MTPTLVDLIRDPARVADLRPTKILPLLSLLGALESLLAVRLMSAAQLESDGREAVERDRLGE